MNPLYWMLLAHADREILSRQDKLEIIKFALQRGSLEALIDGGLEGLPNPLGQRLHEALRASAGMGLVLRELLNSGASVLPLLSDKYPKKLKISLGTQYPLVLYVLGNVDLLSKKHAVAVVGSRKASLEAMKMAHHVGSYFGGEGYVVITGMARGVDEEALKGTLEAGGKAVGVVPFGLLSRKDLLPILGRYQEDILGGRLTLISELHPQAGWRAGYAMARNRIVVGLADGVLVMQSGPKETRADDGKTRQSGTWHAVEVANKQKKLVYVLDLPERGNRELIAANLGKCLPYSFERGVLAEVEDALHESIRQQSVEKNLLLGDLVPGGQDGGEGSRTIKDEEKTGVSQPKLLE